MNLNINNRMILSLIISVSFNPASFAMHDNIHKAAARGDLARVRELIQIKPAAVNVRDQWKNTPLHEAAENGYADVVQILLANGATVDSCGMAQVTPLYVAARKGCLDIVLQLLSRGASIDVPDRDRWTPLHGAAYFNHADVVKLLLQHGAAVNSLNKEHKTPLDLAVEKGNDDVARLLKDWPFYEAYLKRIGLIGHDQPFAFIIRNQAIAFAMALHSRLGEFSAARVLDSASRRYISMMVASPSHTLEEIYEMAEWEREISRQESAQ